MKMNDIIGDLVENFDILDKQWGDCGAVVSATFQITERPDLEILVRRKDEESKEEEE